MEIVQNTLLSVQKVVFLYICTTILKLRTVLMKQNSTKSTVIKQLVPYMGLGFQMAITLLIGLIIGYYIDEWLHTKPFGLIISLLLFSTIAMISFIRTVIKPK